MPFGCFSGLSFARAELYDGAKLFYLSGLQYGPDPWSILFALRTTDDRTFHEVQAIVGRLLKSGAITGLRSRISRGLLLPGILRGAPDAPKKARRSAAEARGFGCGGSRGPKSTAPFLETKPSICLGSAVRASMRRGNSFLLLLLCSKKSEHISIGQS